MTIDAIEADALKRFVRRRSIEDLMISLLIEDNAGLFVGLQRDRTRHYVLVIHAPRPRNRFAHTAKGLLARTESLPGRFYLGL